MVVEGNMLVEPGAVSTPTSTMKRRIVSSLWTPPGLPSQCMPGAGSFVTSGWLEAVRTTLGTLSLYHLKVF